MVKCQKKIKVNDIEFEIYTESPNIDYQLANGQSTSFEAMKDMLQDVYSKQVKIIKGVNYLLDKDERQHRKKQ